MKCKFCSATVADDKDKTLAKAKWGWTLAPDPGLGQDAHGDIPGWWYACPECSDEGHKDAFAWALSPHYKRAIRRARPRPAAPLSPPGRGGPDGAA